MARLKIGSGIQFEAQLPKIEQSEPKVDRIEYQAPSLDIEKMIKDAMGMMPQPEAAKEVDLSHLCTKDEMVVSILKLCKQRDELESKVDELAVKFDELAQDSDVIIPEVKQITHIQDVSPEVLNECKKMLRYSEEAMMLKVNSLQKRVNTQEKMNYVLGGILILTIFLQLL